MSSADVLANEDECADAMACGGTVALSDGKYVGPCRQSEVTVGDFMGCKDITEIMIMTDDGRNTAG